MLPCMASNPLYRTAANLSSAIVAIILSVLGLAMLLVAQWVVPATWLGGSAFVAQLGGLLLATGIVTVGWEMLGRRHFARELMDMAGFSHDLQRSGVVRIDTQYLDTAIWNELFENVTKLDVLVAYAATWRNSHRKDLERVAAKPGSRIRVYLPDPNDDLTLRTLAHRFNTTPEALRSKIEEAAKDFASLGRDGGGTVEVWYRAGDLLFSCYRFDTRAVITLYSHTRERLTSVPTFVTKEGDLYAFVRSELDAIESGARRYQPVTEKD